jgi:hypothetical protein
MATGTGTPASNQNGAVPTGPYGSPGEVVIIGGTLAQNAAVPVVSNDQALLQVTTAYDLVAHDALKPNLIFDQLATVSLSKVTHNGGTKRVFFDDEMAEATTPLLENIDIDSSSFSGRALDLTQREYGNAITRTALAKAQMMIPFDPRAARKVGYNAGLSQDTLARTALFQSTLVMANPDGTALTGTIAKLLPTLSNGSPGYFSTEVLQEACVMLGEQNVEPFADDKYLVVVGDRGEQHIQAETASGLWREWDLNNGGDGIRNGRIGIYQGCYFIKSRRLTNGRAVVLGREALIKTFPGVEGYGPNPWVVPGPITDKLRRFVTIGWHWIGGYSIYRPQALVQITHATTNRALGATNNAIGATAYAEA